MLQQLGVLKNTGILLELNKPVKVCFIQGGASVLLNNNWHWHN